MTRYNFYDVQNMPSEKAVAILEKEGFVVKLYKPWRTGKTRSLHYGMYDDSFSHVAVRLNEDGTVLYANMIEKRPKSQPQPRSIMERIRDCFRDI